jgi:uncharacterized coiled-coil protein SlyX
MNPFSQIHELNDKISSLERHICYQAHLIHNLEEALTQIIAVTSGTHLHPEEVIRNIAKEALGDRE